MVPRPFLSHLWQAALKHGSPSGPRCPSCSQPLLAFAGKVTVVPRCQVCCRCFFVWLDRQAFGSVGLSEPRPRVAVRPPDGPQILDGLERAVVAVRRLAADPETGKSG